jgi:xanthine dehydrogenase YagT iron-sulfur-binding subunit
MKHEEGSNPSIPGFSRREFVGITVAATIASAAPAGAHPALTDQDLIVQQPIACSLTVNGQKQSLQIDSRMTLLDLLREKLQLVGTKKGCDHGQCGACTVLVNGRRINSCLSLAVTNDGFEVTTIEGIGEEGRLHPMQAAFIEHDGLQCGYCTPGQICSAVAVLAEHKAGWPSHVTADVASVPSLSNAEIAERMSGNICRCSAYPNIVAAIRGVVEGEPT